MSTSSSMQDELRRTQQYLAEVIDECVFAERQRELMERRLTSQVDSQKTLLDNALDALEYLCGYTSLMERAVLPSILALLPTSSPSRQELLRARAEVDVKLDLLTKRAEQKGSRLLLLPPLADTVERRQGSVDTTTPRLSSSSDTAAGIDVVQDLLHYKNDLFDALSMAVAKLNAMHLGASSEHGEIQALRVRMDELTRRVESSATALTFGAPTTVPVQSVSPIKSGEATQKSTSPPPPAVRFAQARVLAYEKTVQALNTELALLHENYVALSRANALEMDRLKQKNVEVQRKHDDQVAECDAVLGRLSLELEQLIQENAQLKQKLRAIVDAES